MIEPGMFKMKEAIVSERRISRDGTTNGVAYPNHSRRNASTGEGLAFRHLMLSLQ